MSPTDSLSHTPEPIPKSNLPEFHIGACANLWNKYATLYLANCMTQPSYGPNPRSYFTIDASCEKGCLAGGVTFSTGGGGNIVWYSRKR